MVESRREGSGSSMKARGEGSARGWSLAVKAARGQDGERARRRSLGERAKRQSLS